ncbi:nuclear matrix constituent protein 1-like [Syzygium oleosum]|uniref:nuclear matrix constituent protein 1-like n=1 Tax=Syzygium oleosum TaxID=219896 RepID=UPI0024BAB84C|nr:nuclear matrix constituent protein 1-like [Syzygium oleosum]
MKLVSLKSQPKYSSLAVAHRVELSGSGSADRHRAAAAAAVSVIIVGDLQIGPVVELGRVGLRPSLSLLSCSGIRHLRSPKGKQLERCSLQTVSSSLLFSFSVSVKLVQSRFSCVRGWSPKLKVEDLFDYAFGGLLVARDEWEYIAFVGKCFGLQINSVEKQRMSSCGSRSHSFHHRNSAEGSFLQAASPKFLMFEYENHQTLTSDVSPCAASFWLLASCQEGERKLPDGEGRLGDRFRVLNQREEMANEKDKMYKQKEKDLQEAQKTIDEANLTLSRKEEDMSSRLANLKLKEKASLSDADHLRCRQRDDSNLTHSFWLQEFETTRKNLEIKEKQLVATEEKLDARAMDEIQKIFEDHARVLNVIEKNYKLELEQKMKKFDEDLEIRGFGIQIKEAEIKLKEDILVKREKAVENKTEKLKEKEDEFLKDLEEMKKFLESEDQKLETQKKSVAVEKEELLSFRAALEKIRAENEEQLVKIRMEKDQLKVSEEERSEFVRLQSELKEEREKCRLQTEDLKQLKEAFEKEWDELDEKRTQIEKERIGRGAAREIEIRDRESVRVRAESWESLSACRRSRDAADEPPAAADEPPAVALLPTSREPGGLSSIFCF